MALENEGNTSRPGVVIIAIVALLLVAGLAIWFTTRQPAIERDTSTSTTTTTVPENETQGTPSTPGSTSEQTDGGTNAPPDSSPVAP